jgi:hypothetical protein
MIHIAKKNITAAPITATVFPPVSLIIHHLNRMPHGRVWNLLPMTAPTLHGLLYG